MNKRIIRTAPVEIDNSFNDKFYSQNAALMQKHTIPVVINRYYTDVNGTVINKAAAPASLRVKFPIFLFSQFDRQGGFKKSLQAVPPVENTFYLMTYVVGVNEPFLSFTGLNSIKSKLSTGDLVWVYTDDLEAPNYFVFFVASCNTVSLASVVSNFETTQDDRRIGVLYMREINYYVSIREQFEQALTVVKMDNIGNYRGDHIQPSMFLNPFVEQQGFLTIKTPFRIDQYIGLTTYMVYNCDQLKMDFLVEKLN